MSQPLEKPSPPVATPISSAKRALAAAARQFAGAGANVPSDIYAHPAFFERVPLHHVFCEALHRGTRMNRAYFDKHGKFFVAEVGTYRGRGLRLMLDAAKSQGVKVHITGLDSFEGLPPLSDTDLSAAPKEAPYLKRVFFADTTEREVRAYVGKEYADSYELIPGFFAQSLPTLPKRKYVFALIDCDLYSSHMETMAYFYNRLLPGGVMFFDDYHSKHYPMARLAIDKFMKGKPESLFHIGYGTSEENSMKAYVVKEQASE